MEEKQHLEDDIITESLPTASSSSSLSSSSPIITGASSTLSIKDGPTIVYICSPSQSKQKQLKCILHKFNPSCSVLYYSATSNDGSKMSCSEENDVMAIGSIRFPTAFEAEKAYALLNGTVLSLTPSTSTLPPTTIQLRYNHFSRHSHHGDTTTLLIDHLPDTMTISEIYDLLRQYGPIGKCQFVCFNSDDDNDNGIRNISTVVAKNGVEVAFFQKKDANEAQAQLCKKNINGHSLSITVIAGNKQRDRLENSNTAEAGTSSPNKINKKDKNRLSQQLPQHGDNQTQPLQQYQLQVEIKPTMDLCNLYIKGLSLSMTSNELFNLFKPHGRIISARVMANEQGVSKGFGFVSFSKPIEAASALVHLHHQHYSILFHEPKVPRSDHDIQQQYWSLANSPLAGYFYSTTVSLPPPSATIDTTTAISPPPPLSTTTMPYYLYSAPPPPPPPSYIYPTTTPYYYHPALPPHLYYAPYPYPTPSNPSIQRCEMQQAVQQALTNDKQQQEMVDMLMALDESEKHKCINDIAYLKEKLDKLHGGVR